MDEYSVDDAESLSYQQYEAMKKLSTVFKLLYLGPIHDKVSSQYESLDDISIFLEFMFKSLSFARFDSKQNQARRSIALRRNYGTLTCLQCLRGNVYLSDDTIDNIVRFYSEDGINRVSSNSKDAIQINKQPFPVCFMEMTVLDAFWIFDDRFPGAVGRSTFYSLRPREVKIAPPHEACMCIINENMDRLVKVYALQLTHVIQLFYSN